ALRFARVRWASASFAVIREARVSRSRRAESCAAASAINWRSASVYAQVSFFGPSAKTPKVWLRTLMGTSAHGLAESAASVADDPSRRSVKGPPAARNFTTCSRQICKSGTVPQMAAGYKVRPKVLIATAHDAPIHSDRLAAKNALRAALTFSIDCSI